MNIKKIDKPWGHEIIWAQTENYVAKIIKIKLGKRLSLQYHEKKEETIYVLDGTLCIWESEDDNNFKLLRKGDTYHVSPNQIHRFGSYNDRGTSNVIDQEIGCTLMEVSTNHLDDVVRIKDDYKR